MKFYEILKGFGSKCGSKRSIIAITEDTKKLFLQLHNGVRSIVASGSLKGYKSAERMAYMVIVLSFFHLAHSKCRNLIKKLILLLLILEIAMG